MSFFIEDNNNNSEEELVEFPEEILNIEDTADIKESMQNLDESTIIQINANSKYQSQVNAMAIQIAKEEGDREYEKYISAKKRWVMYRDRLRQRYYSKAKIRVAQNRYENRNL